MNKLEILKYLKKEKADYEKLGYIPTLELLIEDLETETAEEYMEKIADDQVHVSGHVH